MPKLLTATAIEKLKPDPNKRKEVRDGGANGLYLTVHPSGNKTWVLRGRRPDGRQGKVTLGPLDLSGSDDGDPTLGAPLSLRAARVLANQLLRQRAKGVDVAGLATKRHVGNSFPDIVEAYIRDHARPRNRSWEGTAKTLGLIYPDGEKPELLTGGLARRWASKAITEIDADLIWDVIAESRRNGVPGTKTRKDTSSASRAQAMAAALGSLFSWATKHRLVKINPTAGIHRPEASDPRSRVLTDAEIAMVWEAADYFGFPFGKIVKLLVLTGQRRQEITGMRWSELNDDLSILSLPPSRTKNKKPHVVPLPPLAREIVASVPRMVNSDLVFTTNGRTPVSGFSKFKSMLDAELVELEPWRLHDLRRTAVTQMAELGVLPHVIEAVVNHVSGHKGGVAGIYNRAVYMPERIAALERWADHIASITGGQR